MIRQYRFLLSGDGNQPLPSFWAYRLYAWLLTQISADYAQMLHASGEKPIAQYLCEEQKKTLWVVNLLRDDAVEAFEEVLEHLDEVPLHTGTLAAQCVGIDTQTAQQLVLDAHAQEPLRRTVLRFVTPTAFKSEGRYAIFPQEKWMVQTLAAKWNFSFPEMPLDDADALAALERGIHITDYLLRTSRYPLKNIRIPGFLGKITVESRLAAPMEEIWQLLLRAAPYFGVGIKTTLGMGAVQWETGKINGIKPTSSSEQEF